MSRPMFNLFIKIKLLLSNRIDCEKTELKVTVKPEIDGLGGVESVPNDVIPLIEINFTMFIVFGN